jgi:hypothetical protein
MLTWYCIASLWEQREMGGAEGAEEAEEAEEAGEENIQLI